MKLKKKGLSLLSTKLIKKTPNASNSKKYYQLFLRNKIKNQ